jgi:hypothetical protein
MDIKYKNKYLKYKNKYLDLLNQQGGRHTIDQISRTKDGFIFDYDENKFINDPINLDKILISRAVLINNHIYDYLSLFNWIIQNDIAIDPINKQIISVDDLELMYSKAKQNDLGLIFEVGKFEPVKERTRIQYKIQKDKIIDLINEKLFLMIDSQTSLKKNLLYKMINSQTSLNILDLNELKDLLDKKKIILNSLDSKIKDDILRKPFDSMFKILLLTEEEIKKLYSYDSNIYNYNKILNLTINQKQKILSYDDIKQKSILNFNNDEIGIILSIKDISIQDRFLKYDYNIQKIIFDIGHHFNDLFYKLLQLSLDELILFNNKFTKDDIINTDVLSLSLNEIKELINFPLDEIKLSLNEKLSEHWE